MLASALFCTNLMAKAQQSINLDLEPETPRILINYTLYTLEGVCVYTLQEESAVVDVKVLSRSGEINGQPVVEGDEFTITVHNGTHMNLLAKPGARVQLINHSNVTIHAVCY